MTMHKENDCKEQREAMTKIENERVHIDRGKLQKENLMRGKHLIRKMAASSWATLQSSEQEVNRTIEIKQSFLTPIRIKARF